MRDLTIWSPVSDTKLDLPANMEKLGDIKDIPIEDLVKSIENLQDEQKFEFPDNVLMYVLIGIIIIVIIAVMGVLIIKRRAILRALNQQAPSWVQRGETKRHSHGEQGRDGEGNVASEPLPRGQ